MAKKKEQFNKQNNLVLIYGNQYSVDETLTRINNKVVYDEMVRIDGESLSAGQLSNAICSEDMFSSRKLILIKGIPKEDAKNLIKIFPNIASSNFVVFYSYSSLKAKKNLCKYFSDYGKLIEYDLEIKDLNKLISKMLEDNEKNITDEALELMSEYIGKNIGVIKSEVDKLCNYVGNSKDIEIEDVHSVCCLNPEFIIWDLIKHVGDKNIAKAAESLSSAIDGGNNYEFIVLMLMRSIRLGIFLRENDSDGLNSWDMIAKIKNYKKSDGASVYGDYEIRKTYESRTGFFANFSLLELLYSLRSCHNAFISVRKSYKKEEQEKEVSMLMFSICFPSCFIK